MVLFNADGTRSATTATITRLDVRQDPKLPAARLPLG
jgi:hypothetical protein